ncbi:MAG TPA: alpha/beta fold hydrolase [Solirubrobacterales bacterium]|nr:alpha/beta fold hydrolase [Solirubrobacterales bacterium]
MTPLGPREEIILHGHRICFHRAGEGPPLLLVHGITGSARHWERVFGLLAERHYVIAPDLLGHGESAKPRGDYSLGAFASGLRDLLVALGNDRTTVVGHSLGGGIAMQFAYQFPERTERLVLIDSGGLGTDVHHLFRAAALPGSELVLPLITADRLRGLAAGAAGALRGIGLDAGPDLAEMVRGLDTLGDAATRHAFLETLRSVVGPGGQKVDARDRLYLAEALPTLILWGERDPIIPVEHGAEAHTLMPGSRFELFDAGHFPHLEHPAAVAAALARLIAETEPADLGPAEMRERLVATR